MYIDKLQEEKIPKMNQKLLAQVARSMSILSQVKPKMKQQGNLFLCSLIL